MKCDEPRWACVALTAKRLGFKGPFGRLSPEESRRAYKRLRNKPICLFLLMSVSKSAYFLKHRYHFNDFIFHMAFMAIPAIAALAALIKHSPWAAGFFILILAGSILIIQRFFCSHCPHYCRDEKRLNCIFFWQTPKLFSQRPGPLSPMETLLSIAGPALILLYPVYWLIREPVLFMIYLLSILVFGASIRRNECTRCIYTHCPVNCAQADPDT